MYVCIYIYIYIWAYVYSTHIHMHMCAHTHTYMNHHITKGTRVLVHAASFSSGCEGPKFGHHFGPAFDGGCFVSAPSI